MTTAVTVWQTVVTALEEAHYAEVGPQYAKLSALLVQQRAAERLAGQPDRAEWRDLARIAEAAVALLDPVLAAARQLAALRADVDARGSDEVQAPNGEQQSDASAPATDTVRASRTTRRSRTT